MIKNKFRTILKHINKNKYNNLKISFNEHGCKKCLVYIYSIVIIKNVLNYKLFIGANTTKFCIQAI